MLWARSNPKAFLLVMFLRYAALMAAMSVNTSAALIATGLLLLVFNIAVLLWTEGWQWRKYFVRPLAGSLALYATVSELRVLAHSLR